MIKVGITGNYYSGYEEISDIFKNKVGVPVFDADVVLKFIINYREDVIKKIKIKFGSSVYNFGLLKSDVFNTTEKFDCVLDLAQMELLQAYEKWRLVNKDFYYTIFKSAILFERNFDTSMDYTISVFKPKNDRVYEFAKKTHTIVSESYNLINKEMDELEKNKNSTHIIHNYEAAAPISRQVQNVHDSINKKNLTLQKL